MSRSLFQLIVGVLVALLALSGNAIAQQDPPGRVARLNHTEGRVKFLPAQGQERADAELNRPLAPGDQLWADKGIRAEVQLGSAVVRLDGSTWLKVLAMGDHVAQLSLTQGALQVRVRSLPEGENFEIDTPNLAFRFAYPGEARIDVDAARGITQVTIRSGAGAVYGERAQVLPLGSGQQMAFGERSLAPVASRESPPQDNFDRWAAERSRREDQSMAARYVPRELVGYQWLDGNGQWGYDPAFGTIWFPNALPADWAPYRLGRWERIEPWGWTWIDEAPWAFATSHYGRWALVGSRWAWAPGRLPVRPTYAPALVAFVGGPAKTLSFGGKTATAWIPLAPGEPWQSGARTPNKYDDGVNANMKPLPATGHAYLRRPEAFTAMAADDFARGRPLRDGRLTAGLPPQAKVVPPPAVPPPPAGHVSSAAQPQASVERTREAQQDRLAQEQKLAAQQAAQQGTNQAKAAQKQQVKTIPSRAQPTKTRAAESSRAAQQRQAAARTEPSASKREPRKATATMTARKSPERSTHTQQVEAARRAADREMQQLLAQRMEAARRRAEQERLLREALQRQQALGG